MIMFMKKKFAGFVTVFVFLYILLICLGIQFDCLPSVLRTDLMQGTCCRSFETGGLYLLVTQLEGINGSPYFACSLPLFPTSPQSMR